MNKSTPSLYGRQTPHPDAWPRPPCAIPHAWLDRPPVGARVCVAGLVLVRQRPGTAKGVVFVTLEDETGVANVVVWKKVFLAFRRAVVAGRLLRVHGRLERQNGVSHVIAEQIEDISDMLDSLLSAPSQSPSQAPSQPPSHTPSHAPSHAQQNAKNAPQNRARHPRDVTYFGAHHVAQEAGP